jgi:hypothetical protein
MEAADATATQNKISILCPLPEAIETPVCVSRRGLNMTLQGAISRPANLS